MNNQTATCQKVRERPLKNPLYAIRKSSVINKTLWTYF